MVGQERERAALIWRAAKDLDSQGFGSTYYELVQQGEPVFFTHQYATIWKMAKSKWELRIPRNDQPYELLVDVTYHKTLSAAKSVGLVLVRFRQATN
jgi:hypothetical protein